MLSRRNLLKALIATGSAVAIGVVFELREANTPEYIQNQDWQWLNAEQAMIVSLLMLSIYKHPDIELDEAALVKLLINVDKTITLLPDPQQQELKQLLDILSFSLGRLVITGNLSNIQNISVSDTDEILLKWRSSSIVTLNTAYVGIKELLMASFYGVEDQWQAIGYPGPPRFNQ